MITLLSPNFVPQPVTQNDIIIASICWGFTLGFGFLTVWAAIKQTSIAKRMRRSRLTSPYIWMIWLEIWVCLAFSIVCWLYLRGIILPSFAFYFSILTLWALQVQFLLQIIINRIMILLIDRRKGNRIRVSVAILITSINISVYCIWVPARLQISQRFIHINDVWDRCEKVIYLCVDGVLNFYFIRTVQLNLVNQGFKKYESLVKFNLFLVFFSLSMDGLIIAMMSLKNSFVYMQFHPLAYIVKLKIEMSMADLIATVARIQRHPSFSGSLNSDSPDNSLSLPRTPSHPLHHICGQSHGHDKLRRKHKRTANRLSLEPRDFTRSNTSSSIKISKSRPRSLRQNSQSAVAAADMRVYTTREVMVQVERKEEVPRSLELGTENQWPSNPEWAGQTREDDMWPVRKAPHSRGDDEGIGFSTKVWRG